MLQKTTTTLEPRFPIQHVINYSLSSVVIEKRYDVTKIQICEIMGYVGIVRKNKMKKNPLPKISLLVQIDGEIEAPLSKIHILLKLA